MVKLSISQPNVQAQGRGDSKQSLLASVAFLWIGGLGRDSHLRFGSDNVPSIVS